MQADREALLAQVKEAMEQIDVYATYSFPNWDGYGASPIRAETVAAAKALYAAFFAPDIAPGADGSIGFEWRMEETILMADVGADGKVQIHCSHDA